MNLKRISSVRGFVSRCLVVTLALSVTSCFFSARAIYNDKEIAVAQDATARMHALHNQQNFSAIYDLLEKKDPPAASEEILREMKANYDKLGQLLETRLVEQKVFPATPGYTSQVKLAYETKFEKGSWTELFAWNIKNSSQAVLVEHRVEPITAP